MFGMQHQIRIPVIKRVTHIGRWVYCRLEHSGNERIKFQLTCGNALPFLMRDVPFPVRARQQCIECWFQRFFDISNNVQCFVTCDCCCFSILHNCSNIGQNYSRFWVRNVRNNDKRRHSWTVWKLEVGWVHKAMTGNGDIRQYATARKGPIM